MGKQLGHFFELRYGDLSKVGDDSAFGVLLDVKFVSVLVEQVFYLLVVDLKVAHHDCNACLVIFLVFHFVEELLDC
jgi:hypothetical protein